MHSYFTYSNNCIHANLINNNNNNNNNTNSSEKVVSSALDRANQLFWNLPKNFYTHGLIDYTDERYMESPEVVSRFTNIKCPQTTALMYEGIYLHANRVNLYGAVKDTPLSLREAKETPLTSFIATQAPKAESAETFWGVAYNDTNLIVDLTRINELKDQNNRVEDPYYPTVVNETKKFGNISITCKSNQRQSDYITISEYEVKVAGKSSKIISRIHYTNWQDMQGANLEQLDKLIEVYESLSKSPLVPSMVHCRAGVGRTGAFMTLVALKKLFEKEFPNKTSEEMVTNFVTQARIQRSPETVQNPDQVDVLLNYADRLILRGPSTHSNLNPQTTIVTAPSQELLKNSIQLQPTIPQPPKPNVDNEDIIALSKKYRIPLEVCKHPAFYSNDSVKNLFEYTQELLFIAHKIQANQNVYLLRPGSPVAENQPQHFVLSLITPKRTTVQYKMYHSTKTNEWYGFQEDKEKNVSYTSLDAFIEQTIRNVNTGPIAPFEGDIRQRVFALKEGCPKALEALVNYRTPADVCMHSAFYSDLNYSVATEVASCFANEILNIAHKEVPYDNIYLLSPSHLNSSETESENFIISVILPNGTTHYIQINYLADNNEWFEIKNGVKGVKNILFTNKPGHIDEIIRTCIGKLNNAPIHPLTFYNELLDIKNNLTLGRLHTRKMKSIEKQFTAQAEKEKEVKKVNKLSSYSEETIKHLMEAKKFAKAFEKTPQDEKLYHFAMEAYESASKLDCVRADFKISKLKAKYKNDDISQNTLGIFYSCGYGTNKNVTKAFEWYKRSADNGNPSAQLNVAECHEKGFGTDPDSFTALKMYYILAAQGSMEAEVKADLLLNTQ